jgi:RNA polymerase sigma-70 factor (ECF subfamily)
VLEPLPRASLIPFSIFAPAPRLCQTALVRSSLRSSDNQAQAALTAALRSAAGGDRKALREVFDRTSAKLMGICLHVLKDREEAEDVLQEVFVSIWSRAGTFDPAKASPVTWLATIARNRAIDRLRSHRSRGSSAPIDEIADLADERPDGFAIAAAKDEGARIHHCLSALEEKAQDVIRTAFFDGLSYSDIAARSGVPLGTMKSWIRRGLQRLKDCLER